VLHLRAESSSRAGGILLQRALVWRGVLLDPRVDQCNGATDNSFYVIFVYPCSCFAVVRWDGLRALANQYAPNVWQMSLGLAMLAIIMFLPGGLWTLLRKRDAA